MQISYPNLVTRAREYVSKADEEYRSAWGISDEAKVIVGCIANILKPGKSNQVSIQDNEWICDRTLTVNAIEALIKFINKILDLPNKNELFKELV